METVLWVAGGTLLVLASLIEALVAVFHQDRGGIVTPLVHRVTWWSAMQLSRVVPAARRFLMALVGPVMITLHLVLWLSAFVVGFAMIYYPFLYEFISKDELPLRGFISSLYYSGSTGAVLGLGDISPRTPVMQMITVLEAGLGFALLTGTISYVLQAVSQLAARDQLIMRVLAETGGTGKGSDLFRRTLGEETLDDVHDRISTLVDSTQKLLQLMHESPHPVVFYRSERPYYDPEVTFQALAEMAMGTAILAQDPKYRRLKPVGEDFIYTTRGLYAILDKYYVKSSSLRQVQHLKSDSQPGGLIRFQQELASVSAVQADETPPEVQRLALLVASCLTQLESITYWNIEHENRFHAPF